MLMRPLRLDAEWSALFASYEEQHQDARNQACHKVGIPLIAASLPVGATVVGLPLAAGMFTVGWAFQLIGHWFEGKPPAFVSDKRQTIVGLLWWMKKVGALDVAFAAKA
jgi:uncharacterized membrane protein YGL010W